MNQLDLQEQTKALLRYANYAKVAEALGVSRATVAAWAKGRKVTIERHAELEALLRPVDGEAPPGWAVELMNDVHALFAALGLGPVPTPEELHQAMSANLRAIEQGSPQPPAPAGLRRGPRRGGGEGSQSPARLRPADK